MLNNNLGISISDEMLKQATFTLDMSVHGDKMMNDMMETEANYRKNNAIANYKKYGDPERAMKKLASNIGDVGISVNLTDAVLDTSVEVSSPLFDWIRNGSATARAGRLTGLAEPYKDCDGVWQFMLPPRIGTTPGEDTGDACCWASFNIMMCNDKFPVSLLCMEMCEDIMDYLINMKRTPSGGDLTSYFQRAGETVLDARRRMALLTMQWLTINTAILGTITASSGNIKKFHGLFDIMNDEFTLNFSGSNILSAFAQIACRLLWLNRDAANDWGIGVNPTTFIAIASAIKKDRFGEYPAGWNVTYNGAIPSVTFSGITFISDWRVPIDHENNVGEAWLINRSVVGFWFATNLQPTEEYHFTDFNSSNVSQKDCGRVCERWYNIGGAFSMNKYGAMVISNIPLNGVCSGDALLGLDNITNPTSMAPMLY